MADEILVVPSVVHVSTGLVDIRSEEKVEEQKQEVTTVLNEDHSPASSDKFAAKSLKLLNINND